MASAISRLLRQVFAPPPAPRRAAADPSFEAFARQLQKRAEAALKAQRIAELSPAEIDEMVRRKDDLEFLAALCRRIMDEGKLLPFPFHRLVVLLRKARRYEEEIAICDYVANWAQTVERDHIEGAMVWKSPSVRAILARRDKAAHLLTRSAA